VQFHHHLLHSSDAQSFNWQLNIAAGSQAQQNSNNYKKKNNGRKANPSVGM